MKYKRLDSVSWKKFLDMLNSIKNTNYSKELYLKVKKCVLKHIDIFSAQPFSKYNIIEYCRLDIDQYPIYTTQAEMEELVFFIKNLNKYSFNDKESIARVISELLEYLFVFRVNTVCKFCNSDGMVVYKNIVNSKLVYECPQCGNAVYVDNEVIQSVDQLTLPSKSDLEEYGLLK